MRVRVHPDFQLDLRRQLRWMQKHRDRSYVMRLRAELRELRRLVASSPGIGSPMATDGTVILRKLILRTLPYVVWYFHDDADPTSAVWLGRLFHAHQDRPPPTMP